MTKDQALPITTLLHSLALSLLPPLSCSHFPADRVEHLFILANQLLRKSLEQSNLRCLESARIWTRFDPAFKRDEGEGSPRSGVWGGWNRLPLPPSVWLPAVWNPLCLPQHLAAGMSPLSAASTQAALMGIRWSIRLAYKMLMAFSKPRTSPAQEQGN